jgi:hypothetical protein
VEVLFNPAASGPTGNDGRAFVELAGNLPAKPDSGLLGGYVLRTVHGDSSSGSAGSEVASVTLPPGASPRANGLFVVGDGVRDSSTQTGVPGADAVWPGFDRALGPRGLQLLAPLPPAGPPCGTSLLDAFGWSATGATFTTIQDSLRNCAVIEGQEYVVPTQERSAARENLSSSSDTTYNVAFDTNQNRADFCVMNPPSPGALNVRTGC